MKASGNIIVFILWLISYASAQNVTRKPSINMVSAKYIELKDIPNHLGDTVCVYGHVRDFKTDIRSKTIIVHIDSASNGKPFTLNLSYFYKGALPYFAKGLKNNNITAWGVITGSNDKPELISKMFMPEDSTGTWLANFNMMVQLQKNRVKNPKAHITKVVLAPPPKLDTKEDYYKYLSTLGNVTLSWCDVVSEAKFYLDEQLTELSLQKNEVLVIIIKGKIRDEFRTPPETLFLNKQICTNGKVIPYKDKFAINITDVKQIEIVGN